MNTRSTLIPAAILTLALSAAIGAAHAQPASRGGPDMISRMCVDHDARLASRLAYAEAKLTLTAPQKEEFRRLADGLKAAHEPIKALCAAETAATAAAKPGTPVPLAERLDRQAKLAEAHAESLRRTAPVLTRFIATLTPEQQALAEQLLQPGPGGHGPKGDRGPGGSGGCGGR